ncbi:hypothetical protein V1277_001435 [Bradyrhizobium sp. AZCC 1588]|uniref:hypothetical protein n=1 Tax=unclassified Bradyrhizobium TaxID=2631580 RepID=UPI002FF37B9B
MNDQPASDPADKFYAQYGRCINEWALIEERYFNFFAFALRAPTKNAAIVFYEWKDFATPARLTNKLMEKRLRKFPYTEHLKVWQDIAKRVDRLRPFRNELAHQPIRHWRRIRLSIGKSKPLTEEEKKKAGLGPFQEVYRSPSAIMGGRKPKLFNSTLSTIRIDHLDDHLKQTKELRVTIDEFGQALDQTIQEQSRRVSAYIEHRLLRPIRHSEPAEEVET